MIFHVWNDSNGISENVLVQIRLVACSFSCTDLVQISVRFRLGLLPFILDMVYIQLE